MGCVWEGGLRGQATFLQSFVSLLFLISPASIFSFADTHTHTPKHSLILSLFPSLLKDRNHGPWSLLKETSHA